MAIKVNENAFKRVVPNAKETSLAERHSGDEVVSAAGKNAPPTQSLSMGNSEQTSIDSAELDLSFVSAKPGQAQDFAMFEANHDAQEGGQNSLLETFEDVSPEYSSSLSSAEEAKTHSGAAILEGGNSENTAGADARLAGVTQKTSIDSALQGPTNKTVPNDSALQGKEPTVPNVDSALSGKAASAVTDSQLGAKKQTSYDTNLSGRSNTSSEQEKTDTTSDLNESLTHSESETGATIIVGELPNLYLSRIERIKRETRSALETTVALENKRSQLTREQQNG